MTTTGGAAASADVVTLSVHGPAGVVDLVVPSGASGADVAAEYARLAGFAEPFELATRLGRRLAESTTLAEVGLRSGAVLVAVAPLAGGRSRRRGMAGSGRALTRGSLSGLWLCVAAAAAVVAGALAASLPDSSSARTAVLVALVAAAALSAVPVGPLSGQRVHAAPAFAAAAAFGVVWNPAPERLPLVLGVTALAGAATAAVCRGLDQQDDEGLRIWIFVGGVVFAVTALAAVFDASTPLVWSAMLVVAMLAARFVPGLAVDVPDQYLLDLERLAVTAWSARDRPVGRRGRIIVPRRAVAAVASSGTRTTTAACVAILVVTAVAAPMLLRDADLEVDRWGARARRLLHRSLLPADRAELPQRHRARPAPARRTRVLGAPRRRAAAAGRRRRPHRRRGLGDRARRTARGGGCGPRPRLALGLVVAARGGGRGHVRCVRHRGRRGGHGAVPVPVGIDRLRFSAQGPGYPPCCHRDEPEGPSGGAGNRSRPHPQRAATGRHTEGARHMSHSAEYGQGQGTLTRAAGLVDAARQDFTGYSQQLTGKLSSLRGQWGGQGANAFFVLEQAWTEKQATIVKALDDFSQSLGQTERVNTSNDDDQSGRLGNLTSRLG